MEVTTDYRQILGELLTKRLGNTHLDAVFPGFKLGASLGLMKG